MDKQATKRLCTHSKNMGWICIEEFRLNLFIFYYFFFLDIYFIGDTVVLIAGRFDVVAAAAVAATVCRLTENGGGKTLTIPNPQ